MHLEIEMPQIDRNKVFRCKQPPNKVPLLFLDVKIFKKRYKRRF